MFDTNEWERAHSKYFLRIGDAPEQEVSEDQFIAAERAAGFIPQPGCGPIATAGFGAGNVSGRIEYVPDNG